MTATTEPNSALREVRLGLRMSQDELARAVREAGQRTGEPNDCSKRLIQRWEAGIVAVPRPVYVRALEYATGQPIASLGFGDAAQRYGLARRQALGLAGVMMLADPSPRGDARHNGPLTGIWLSTYTYESSSRGESFTDRHYCMVIQRGDKVQIRTLPNTARSQFMMDLTLSGQVLTGNWTENSDPSGYYEGAVYHGAIQLLLEPTGRRMAGKWVGFGRDFEVNTGPWELRLVSADTGRESVERFDRPPSDDD